MNFSPGLHVIQHILGFLIGQGVVIGADVGEVAALFGQTDRNGQNGNILLIALLDLRGHGFLILRQDDHAVNALVDGIFNLGDLLGGVTGAVVADKVNVALASQRACTPSRTLARKSSASSRLK